MVSPILTHSSSESMPLRTRCMLMLAAEHKRRRPICSLGISMLNTATQRRALQAANCVTPSAMDVLPIAGRAPTSTSSPPCRQVSMRSRSYSPVGTPASRPLRRLSSSIWSKVDMSTLLSGTSVSAPARLMTMSKMRRSALCKTTCSDSACA